jgi:hypothetical protein
MGNGSQIKGLWAKQAPWSPLLEIQMERPTNERAWTYAPPFDLEDL